MEFDYPLNRSLLRPRLAAGVEMIALCVAVVPPAGIGFLVMANGGYKYGALLWVIAIGSYFGCRQLAKKDPYMCQVYFRSWRYHRLYAPRPTIHHRYSRSLNAGTKRLLWSALFLVLAVGFIWIAAKVVL